MKAHTSDFKEQIKTMGRELDSKITYTLNGLNVELGKEQLNSITPTYQGALLKSVMKELDIDSNVYIPEKTILNYQFGVKVNGEYEYINFGNYVVYKVEKQEDTNSYKLTCYDKMLYSMIDYEKMDITYPISIRDYIKAICDKLDITFANESDTFANYDKQIQNELYLDSDGNSLEYTFRDVFDELSQVTASCICINENDELEIRYINDTSDTIDEEFLKDVNVNFGERFGAVNTIVLSRSAESDNVYYPETLPENPYEFKISDNQIMNGNDRSDYLPAIYEKLNSLEFYLNDFSSTGICYYELLDRYNVQIGDNTYSCVMLNDEINVTQGLEENIYTEMPKETQTDYNTSSKDDREKNRTTLIVDKVNGTITGVVEKVEELSDDVNKSLENIKAQYQYELTKDETYQEDKTYYVYNSSENKYEAFESYSVGDTIPENTIYEYVKIKDSIEDSLNSKYNELLDRFTQYTPTSQLDSIINKVVQEQTDTYTKTEIQQIANGTGADGVKVTAVISTEATFDKDGMHYAKTGAKANSTINQDGLEVDGVGDEGVYLYAGYVEQNDNRFNTSTRTFNGSSIVYTRNLKTTGDTIIGNHCLIMDYEDDGYQGTGWFNI